MGNATSEKQRRNVTLTAQTVAAARKAQAAKWAEENATAIVERRDWIEAKGTALADVQVFKSN